MNQQLEHQELHVEVIAPPDVETDLDDKAVVDDDNNVPDMNCNGCVKVKYRGRYGNKLFIYFTARLYAEEHNLNLLDNIEHKFFEVSSPKHFGKYSGNKLKTYMLRDSDIKDNKLPYYGKGIYVFDKGLFQNENMFYENKEKMLTYVNLKYDMKDNFTIHVRLSDFKPKLKKQWKGSHLVISIDYYIYCIKKYANNYKNIYIICDKLKQDWEKNYMLELKEKIKLLNKTPIYTENSLENDMMSIIQSNYIVTSNSTLCFWAVFFSNNEKIILFPYEELSILPDKKFKKWPHNPKIFKYNNDKKFITTFEYSNNVNDYFHKL